MTRIIGGTAKGRLLRTPPGDRTRPTTDRVREALFSILVSQFGSLQGLTVLDLYAGSGALGLEALSRGAGQAIAVEADRRAAQIIRANAHDLGLPLQVHHTRVERFLGQQGEAGDVDIVIADPPYDADNDSVTQVLGQLLGWLSPQALVVVERSARSARLVIPTGLDEVGERTYGETVLVLLEAAASNSEALSVAPADQT